MREAFQLESGLLRGTPLRVEALSCWGGKLILGTTEGMLYVCENNPRTPGRLHIVHERGFSRRAVIQLAVLDDLGICLALSDGVLSSLSLQSLESSQVVHSSKVTVFHVARRTNGSVVLCVAVGARLWVYEWDEDLKAFGHGRELAVPEAICAMTYLDGAICLGFSRAYSVIDLASEKLDKIFKTGKSGVALMASTGEELVLHRDEMGIYVNKEGKPTRKHGLVWSQMPVAVAASSPYMVAIIGSEAKD